MNVLPGVLPSAVGNVQSCGRAPVGGLGPGSVVGPNVRVDRVVVLDGADGGVLVVVDPELVGAGVEDVAVVVFAVVEADRLAVLVVDVLAVFDALVVSEEFPPPASPEQPVSPSTTAASAAAPPVRMSPEIARFQSRITTLARPTTPRSHEPR